MYALQFLDLLLLLVFGLALSLSLDPVLLRPLLVALALPHLPGRAHHRALLERVHPLFLLCNAPLYHCHLAFILVKLIFDQLSWLSE